MSETVPGSPSPCYPVAVASATKLGEMNRLTVGFSVFLGL